METKAFIVAALLGTVSLRAQTPVVNLHFTSASGGTDTLATWTFTGGSFGFNNIDNALNGLHGIVFRGADDQAVSLAYSGFQVPTPYAGPFAVTLTSGLSTGIVFTNTTTNATRVVDRLMIFPEYGAIVLGWDSGLGTLQVFPGQGVVITGPASGSFLTGISFGEFNEGQWTLDLPPSWTFDSTTTVGGTPVPEPSTYGLILGGLALAGAAIRRRKAKQA